jgi:ankyrin repeat protein
MRLLNTETLVLEAFGDEDVPPFAILSHRWGKEEVTLEDVQAGRAVSKQGYEKIQKSSSMAKANGLAYIWIDTCCIDKTSSAELSEAINSMYRWYQESDVCYAYLGDVPSKRSFSDSEWFTRGWTLQELIAPAMVIFFDDEWDPIGTKAELRQIISQCTSIPMSMLLQEDDLEQFSIAQRMSWASRRITTRVEDRAYCMMGLFRINMPLIYGERETAFVRLQEEIMKLSDDHSLFAWTTSDNRSGLLATSPSAFIHSHNIEQHNPFETFNSPMTSTSRGIHLELRFVGRGRQGFGMGILHCRDQSRKRELIVIPLRDVHLTMELFERLPSLDFERLDVRNLRPSQYPLRKLCIRAGRERMATSKSQRLCQGLGNFSKDLYSDDVLTEMLSIGNSKALLSAALGGQEDHVWLLLTRNDIDVNFKDDRGRTALMFAAMKGHTIITKILLAQAFIEVDGKDRYGKTALSWAAESGYTVIVKMLTMKNADVETRDLYGQTPLLWAATAGQGAVVRLLLEKGADLKPRDCKNRTPLSCAVRGGHVTAVRLLLERGLNFSNMDTCYDQEQILAAARFGHDMITKQLLCKGVSAEAKDATGQTPLSWAATNSHEAVVKLLIKEGADLEIQFKNGLTLLWWAAGNGQEDVMKLLLDRGASLKTKDGDGYTPLLLAASNGHESLVRLLLQKGAEHRARNNSNQTSLLLAVKNGHEAVVKLLLEIGANPKVQDDDGWTPLLWAASNKHEVMLTLLENGDTDSQDGNQGRSLSWATRKTREAAALLKNI